MWEKILLTILTDKRTMKTVVSIVAGTAFTIFLLVYAIIASPWTLLTGWIEDAFNGGIVEFDPNYYSDNFFSMANQDAYKKNFEQMGTEYIEAITEPYLKHWQNAEQGAMATAEQLGRDHATNERHDAVCDESNCSEEHEEYSIVYSSFATGNRVSLSNDPAFPFFANQITVDDCDPLNPLDIALITAYFNNVGLEWDCYAGNHKPGECIVCDAVGPGALTYVLDAMNVPKDSNGNYIPELASVDADKLINLIGDNIDQFFVEHIPQPDGSCSLGRDCTMGHIARLVRVDKDSLPKTYSDLITNPAIEEPYFGIYFTHYCEEHEHPGDEDTDPYTDHIWHTDHTAVGFVEYRGFEFFKDYLHLEAFDGATDRVAEAYSNMRDILDQNSLTDYSLQIDSLLQNYEPKIFRYTKFPGAVGDKTKLPIRVPGPLQISAGFLDSEYAAALGTQHWGVDFAYPKNTPVYATSYGEVVHVQTEYTDGVGFGRYVVTYQGKNDRGDKYYFIYAHLNSVNVSEGMMVTPSKCLGYVGTTGNSTGYHLHYECRVVRADGTIESIDPFSVEGGLEAND